MKPRLPKAISDPIRSLGRELVPGGEPRFVELRPVPDAAVSDCFPVVAGRVAREGGAVCHGWRFWELPGIFVEAEFHAVWRNVEGVLIDISPIPMKVDRILFLPDPARVYEGRQVNNVRRALRADPAIQEFFRACDAGFELMNRGERAEQHGRIVLEGPEKEEWVAIETKKGMALATAMSRIPAPGRNDPCPCESGKKFKKCHGAG